MRIIHLVLVLASLAAVYAPVSAQNLAKMDRTIKKEPIYQTKAVKYCLLVFGPEAKTRVWLVHDGDNLYVDRNGNGDLTEPGEKVVAKKGDNTDLEEAIFEFEAGDIAEGKLTHKGRHMSARKIDHMAARDEEVQKTLATEPKFRGYSVYIEVAMPGWQGEGVGGRVAHLVPFRDVSGLLRFGNTPGEAPILHFGGPWQITLQRQPGLTVGREKELYLGIATPGLGPGTLAFIGYEGVVPEKAFPKVEITYPPKQAGDTPAKELYEIKDRC
jgi:hypothetical protein